MNYMAKVLKAVPPMFRFPFLAIIAAVGGFFVFGWQDEICIRNVADGKLWFEFPFYIGGEVNIWVARDFWYTFLGLCILLFGWGVYQLGYRDELSRLRNKVRTWLKKS